MLLDLANIWVIKVTFDFLAPLATPSFDFVVETLGIYQSETLVQQSCEILATNLTALYDAMVEGNENVVQIKRNTENTIPNCWDIVLHNEDYTLGTMLQDKLYRGFYLPDGSLKRL